MPQVCSLEEPALGGAWGRKVSWREGQAPSLAIRPLLPQLPPRSLRKPVKTHRRSQEAEALVGSGQRLGSRPRNDRSPAAQARKLQVRARQEPQHGGTVTRTKERGRGQGQP